MPERNGCGLASRSSRYRNQTTGAILFYLLPCSPDFNPIENANIAPIAAVIIRHHRFPWCVREPRLGPHVVQLRIQALAARHDPILADDA